MDNEVGDISRLEEEEDDSFVNINDTRGLERYTLASYTLLRKR